MYRDRGDRGGEEREERQPEATVSFIKLAQKRAERKKDDTV